MKVISVVNTKGGAGKSTIAVNLAIELANQGKRVIIFDTDGNQKSSFVAIEERNKNSKLNEVAVVPIPSASIYRDVQKYESFDYVVMDAGAGDTRIVRAVIASAHFGILLIPVKTSGFDVWGTEDTLKIVRDCRETGIELPNVYIVFNQMPIAKNSRIAIEAKEAVGQLSQQFEVRTLENVIHDRIIFKECTTNGMSASEYSRLVKHKGYEAGQEINNVLDEVLEIISDTNQNKGEVNEN